MKKLKLTKENLDILENDFKKGEPIALPTDTNYNLICDPFNETGIKKIFEYKKRSFDKPLSLFLLDPLDMLKYSKDYDYDLVSCIINNFLPGPLNIILNKNTDEFDAILNGSNSIAFGSVSNKNWRTLVEQLDGPIALTSANISGTADNCLVDETMLVNQMQHNLKHYVEGFERQNSKSSTILKIVGNKISLVREGDISLGEIMVCLDKGEIVYEN